MGAAVDIQSALRIISDAGVIGLLVAILIGGSRGWWVFGHHYKNLMSERDEWRRLALNGNGLAERGTRIGEHVVHQMDLQGDISSRSSREW